MLQSRRKAVALSFVALIAMLGRYVSVPYGDSTNLYYIVCFLLGLPCGYWAMFVQMGAEQFGTNIRATAATTIPNLVRGATIPMTATFHALIPLTGIVNAGLIVMGVVIGAAAVALVFLSETFHADLDYTERSSS